MRRNMTKMKLFFISIIIVSLALVLTGPILAGIEEKDPANQDSRAEVDKNGVVKFTGEPKQKPTPEYAPGELIVKLKEGKTPDDIQELNAKYNVSSIGQVFKEVATSPPQDRLQELKNKLANVGNEHQKWYWQMDKNSQEYKDYVAKIEKEKDELKKQIQAQEELVASLEQRQKRVPEGVDAPDLKNIYLLKTSPDTVIPAMAAEYQNNPAVEYAEPNYLARAQMVPNDPLYPQQWSHKVTGAEQGWDYQTGSANVVIAIIDTGIDYNHEDLAANIWRDSQGNPGRDFVDIDTGMYIGAGFTLFTGEDYTGIDDDPSDYFGHGTHCAGIAGAKGNNGVGISGVCQHCKIMAVRAGFSINYLGESEVGLFEDDDIVNAVRFAADNGADIISMSLGGSEFSQLLKEAIAYAYSQGVILIAAAGNKNSDVENYPAAYDGVISVAATAQDNTKAGTSNFGKWVDVAAPGDMILSTVPKVGGILSDASGYMFQDGTSMACPYVAGIVGLLLSKNPLWSAEDIKQILMQNTDAILSQEYYIGTGLVNIQKILEVPSSFSTQDIIAKITLPRNDQPLTQDIQEVKGLAFGQEYTLFYGEGVYPLEWREIGRGLADKANEPGILVEAANIDINDIPTDKCTLELRVRNSRGAVYDRVLLDIIKFLKKDFTGTLFQNFDISLSSPTVEDLDNDGFPELIIANGDNSTNHVYDGRLYVFKSNGQLFSQNWPKGEGGYLLSAAAGDISGDKNKEIVCVNREFHKIYIYSADGVLLKEKLIPADWTWSYISPVLQDINRDGKDEIILLVGNLYELNADNSQLYVFDNYLNIIPGWPRALSGKFAYREPAIADLNKDGSFELVTVSQKGDVSKSIVEVWSSDGNIIWSRPVNTSSSGAPLVVDFELDGHKEIIFSVYNLNKVYAFDCFGADYPGWPIDLLMPVIGAVGDVNQDSYPELILSTGYQKIEPGINKINIIDKNGNILREIYPEDGTDIIQQPIICDIDSDGVNEIIFSGLETKKIYGFNADGSVAAGFPKELYSMLSPQNTPAVIDLDKDGKLELIAGGLGVRVWQLPDSNVANTGLIWPQFLANAKHTGEIISLPSAPAELKANALSPTQINLRWQDNSDNETGFRIEESTDGINFSQIREVRANVKWYPVKNLTTGLTYYFRVYAYNAVGQSQYSNTASTSLTVPLPPTNLSATALSSTQIRLNWVDNSTNEKGFKLEISLDGQSFSAQAALGINKQAYTISGLLPGTQYYFRLYSYNGVGNSDFSELSAMTKALPAAPTELKASALSATQIRLSWLDNSADEKGFKIEMSLDGQSFNLLASTFANKKAYTVSGLEANKKYYFRVYAFRGSDKSEFSNVAEATTTLLN